MIHLPIKNVQKLTAEGCKPDTDNSTESIYSLQHDIEQWNGG